MDFFLGLVFATHLQKPQIHFIRHRNRKTTWNGGKRKLQNLGTKDLIYPLKGLQYFFFSIHQAFKSLLPFVTGLELSLITEISPLLQLARIVSILPFFNKRTKQFFFFFLHSPGSGTQRMQEQFWTQVLLLTVDKWTHCLKL